MTSDALARRALLHDAMSRDVTITALSGRIERG